MDDARIAYGARCTWWGSIAEVGLKGPYQLPCCPKCGGMLFEVENEDAWFAGVRRHEADGHDGYEAVVRWARGQCFPTHNHTMAAYRNELVLRRFVCRQRLWWFWYEIGQAGWAWWSQRYVDHLDGIERDV